MSGRIFVDANVFVYRHDDRYPAKKAAAKDWLDRLWQNRLGRTSAQALSEYYVNVTRKLARPLAASTAWAYVRKYGSWNPCAVDLPLLARAQRIAVHHQISWWDGLIVAAAQRQGCATLLTEDLQDGGVYAGVKVLNPFASAIAEPAPALPRGLRAWLYPDGGAPRRDDRPRD